MWIFFYTRRRLIDFFSRYGSSYLKVIHVDCHLWGDVDMVQLIWKSNMLTYPLWGSQRWQEYQVLIIYIMIALCTMDVRMFHWTHIVHFQHMVGYHELTCYCILMSIHVIHVSKTNSTSWVWIHVWHAYGHAMNMNVYLTEVKWEWMIEVVSRWWLEA